MTVLKYYQKKADCDDSEKGENSKNAIFPWPVCCLAFQGSFRASSIAAEACWSSLSGKILVTNFLNFTFYPGWLGPEIVIMIK